MQRTLGMLLVVALSVLLGGALMRLWMRPVQNASEADGPTVIAQMREVARLETLDATLFKKISFEPAPVPQSSLWGDVRQWAKFTLAPSNGKAIVFADVHLGLDVRQLDADHVRLTAGRAEVVLPPLITTVSLRPADTEVIRSNLDSKETAELLELAKNAFAEEVQRDPVLRRRAEASAERALRGLLMSFGFREVKFVPSLPKVSNAL